MPSLLFSEKITKSILEYGLLHIMPSLLFSEQITKSILEYGLLHICLAL